MSTSESKPALFTRPIEVFVANRSLELSASFEIRVFIKIFE
jgi:hypothetical protein